MRLKLGQRTSRYAYELGKVFVSVSFTSFSDVRGYRRGSSTYLRAKAIGFFFWKHVRKRICQCCEVHGFLPHVEIFIG